MAEPRETDWRKRAIRRLRRRGLPKDLAEAYVEYDFTRGCGCCGASWDDRKEAEEKLITTTLKYARGK